MKKKIFIGFTALLALIVILAGAYLYYQTIEENWKEKLEKKTISYQEVVGDSLSFFTSVKKANALLETWSQGKNISTSKIGDSILAVSKKASPGKEDLPENILFCTYDTLSPKSSVDSIALALAILKSDMEQGPVKVIFAGDTDRSFSEYTKIPKSLIPGGSSVFVINSGKKHMYSMMTGGSKAYNLSKAYSSEGRTKEVAIKIFIDKAPGGIPDTKISSNPNPVTIIGKILAKMQSDALNFELAEFNGGNGSSIYPESATATIVVNKDDFDRFNNKLLTAQEDFKDKYKKDFPDAKFSYEVIQSLPEKVITKEDSSRLLSLLYTMIDGIYYKDEDGEVVCISSINMVSTVDGIMSVKLNTSSLSSAMISEMDQTILTLAGLSEFNSKVINNVDIWTNSKGSNFAHDIKDSYMKFTSEPLDFIDSVPSAATTNLGKGFKSANIISITTTPDSLKYDGGIIMTYIMDQK
ncbi:hypothetical protein ACGCUQ_03235 [Eubacteriales bacterium KG127]